jgi:hypothetical protein
MLNVLDTPFEMSLRILLLLFVGGGGLTIDRLALMDTITVYSGNFGITDENLHGDSEYVLDEFDARRELAKEALRTLVTRGLVVAGRGDEGFVHRITDTGRKYAKRFDSEYAIEYCELAQVAYRFAANKTERELFAAMNRRHITNKGEYTDG